MHPDDLAVVEKHLSEDFAGRKLSFISEASISRGGLKLMTATTDIDGTFETRWERVTASLDALDWQGLPNRKKTEAAAEDADEDTNKELETSEAIQDQVEAEL
jgi:hypothetical protein